MAVNSGTAALHAAMFAIGIGLGDEVIIPPLSFAATANCVLYMGATPIFADVEYETGLLDPKEVEKKLRLRLGQLSPWITQVIPRIFQSCG